MLEVAILWLNSATSVWLCLAAARRSFSCSLGSLGSHVPYLYLKQARIAAGDLYRGKSAREAICDYLLTTPSDWRCRAIGHFFLSRCPEAPLMADRVSP